MDGGNGVKTIVYNTKKGFKERGTEKKRLEKRKREIEQKVEETQQ